MISAEDDHPSGFARLDSDTHYPPTGGTCPGGGGTCTFTVEFMITNISSVDVTNNFQILIEAEEVPLKTITINGLAAGASQRFSQTLGPGNNCYNPNCTVRVTVDFTSTILEIRRDQQRFRKGDIG